MNSITKVILAGAILVAAFLFLGSGRISSSNYGGRPSCYVYSQNFYPVRYPAAYASGWGPRACLEAPWFGRYDAGLRHGWSFGGFGRTFGRVGEGFRGRPAFGRR